MRTEKVGRAELYLADCMDLMKEFPDKYFELAIVDPPYGCLLYTSDAADDQLCVDLGGRRIIKKKNNINSNSSTILLI